MVFSKKKEKERKKEGGKGDRIVEVREKTSGPKRLSLESFDDGFLGKMDNGCVLGSM